MMPEPIGSTYDELLGSFDVVLASSNPLARSLNMAVSCKGAPGAFGGIVMTFSSWLSDLWEMAGDGRIFATSVQSAMVMADVLEGMQGDALVNRPNLAIAAQRCYAKAAGLSEFEAGIEDAEDISLQTELLPSEKALLACFGSYRERLAKLGLIEQGDAVSYLAAHAREAFTAPIKVCVLTDSPLPPLQERFFKACAAAGMVELSLRSIDDAVFDEHAAPRIGKAADGLSLRFAFPSGAYAQPQMLLNIIGEVGTEGGVVISVKDPLALYEGIAPVLAKRGVRCAVVGRKHFADTDFGSAFLALAECIDSDVLPWDRALLADVLASPLLCPNRASLWKWDGLVRGNRQLKRDEAIEELCDKSAVFSALHGLVVSPGTSGFQDMESAIEDVRGVSSGWADEQKAALTVVRELFWTASRQGVDPENMAALFRPLLQSASIDVRYADYKKVAGIKPDVLVEDQRHASQMLPGECATLVVCDLDSSSYPVSCKGDAMSILLDKLGVPLGEDYLTQMRRTWLRLVAAPSENLIVGRCLNDRNANPCYPCAILEEFVDCYRSDTSQTDDIDNVFALPIDLQRGMNLPDGATGMFLMGEEDLQGDVTPGRTISSMEPSCTSMDEYEAHDRIPILKGRGAGVDVEGKAGLDDGAGTEEAKRAGGTSAVEANGSDGELWLSPGQIETYLACPRLWFLTKRLKAETLDEDFGPRELGSYRHAVLQRFYGVFQAEHEKKVTNVNMGLARDVMGRVLDQVVHESAELDSGDSRCVPLPGTTEDRALETVKNELRGWLPFERDFLKVPKDAGDESDGSHPSFCPVAFELDLAPYDIEYAGCKLSGRIDRVDISPTRDRAFIVDYKGAIGADYDYGTEKGTGRFDLVRKVQALIYATAILKSRKLGDEIGMERAGMPVAGALYVSYRRGNEVRGVYSSDAVSREASIPHLSSRNKGLDDTSLLHALEDIEEQIATEVVEPIMRGYVEPRIRAKSKQGAPCKNCPDVSCRRRVE